MSREERKLLAEKLLDLANIVAGAMVFGQFVSGQEFSISVFGVGLLITIFLYLGGYGFSRWRKEKENYG